MCRVRCTTGGKRQLTTAGAELAQTLAEVYQIRVSLGLPAQPGGGGDLGQVPPDLDETFSSVLEAQAALIQSAAQLGVVHSFDQGPKAMLDQFYKLGDVDTTFAQFAANAPAVKQAEAKLEAARRDLAQAELDLRYTDITAEIDGVVTRRNVNPGNFVQVGQNLMAVRSLNEIWVDANFKETQLRDLRIGQQVDLRVDMYGGTHSLQGPGRRLHHGNRIDPGIAAAGERHGQFRQGGPAVAGSDRSRRLQRRSDTAVHRHLGGSLCRDQQAADRTRCREVPPDLYVAVSEPWPDRQRVGRQAMTDAVASSAPLNARSRAATNPWVVAAVVVVPTFMEVLDTTIAVVALRYIAGGLSATVDDGEWVLTSYLAANAIILPITGWLIAHLGRRNYFLLSIAVFTLASGLCGMATSLGQLILFRVLQGLAGGGLQPSSQGVLLDAFPVERQGVAMTLFGLAALIAPVVGPTLGGWITDSYSWRWVFLINVPVGLLALGACAITLRDPDYLIAQRTELQKRPFSFDGVGLSLLVIVIVCWEVTLSKGQEWDWLGDPFWRVQTLVILFAVGLAGLIVWELRHPSPVVNFRPLRERNFAACCIIIFCAFAVLYAASTSLPALLQSLFGYDALSAGLVMSPAGFFAVVAMPIVGRLLGRGTDARWVLAAGLLTMAAGNYWMSQMNLDISPGQAVWPRVVLIVGLAMCFAPANVAAYLYTPLALRGAAVGLLSLLRNEGGSVGTSLAQTVQERRDQFHSLRLGELLDPFNPAARSFLDQATGPFLQQTGDPVAAQQLALQTLANLRQQQASALAYFDVFWVLAVVMVALVFVVLLMKRSVAEKGARIGGE